MPSLPELPEVETTMRALKARLQGRTLRKLVQRRPDLRFPLPANLPRRLAGAQVRGFSRRAKYILISLSGDRTLVLHLGMSGRLLFDGGALAPHEHLTFHFDDGTVLRFVDPRRFGMLDLCASSSLTQHRWLAHLGLEPLSPEFDGLSLHKGLNGKLSAIKTAIMDQRLVVGVGNIYASESLFRARVSPRRMAGGLGPARAGRLARCIKEVLSEAIDAGGSSLRDYVQASGELGNFQSFFDVYDRADEPCTVCGKPVQRIVQTGRATFFCGRCQR